MSTTLRCTVDGESAALTADLEARPAALEPLHVAGLAPACKRGCAPQALCGCCALLVDGRPRLACTLPLKALADKDVRTARGIEGAELLADCLAAEGAIGCGYCTPGMIVSASALLEETLAPEEDAIARALAIHLCRCTGYGPIVRAIQRAGAVRRDEAAPPPVAASHNRARALGHFPWLEERAPAGALCGTVILAPHAGRVTGLTLPEAAPGLTVCVLRPEGSEVVEGEPVVALAAETSAVLEPPRVQVQIHLTDTPPSLDVHARAARRDGDPAQALRDCALRVRHTLRVDFTDSAPLEPESALAWPGEEGLDVHSHAHDPTRCAAALSHRLGVQVRVVRVPSGGGFHARAGEDLEEAAASLALAAGRAVRVRLPHEESVRLRAKRPAVTVEVEAGGGPDGALLVLEVDVVVHGGRRTYDADVLVAEAMEALPAVCAHRQVRVEARAGEGPRTASGRGALSGPVAAAVAVALEQLRRAATEEAPGNPGAGGSGRPPQRPWPPEAEALREALEGTPVHPETRHVIVALGSAGTPGGARVRLAPTADGRWEVHTNVPDVGLGRDEALLAALSSASGLPAESFRIGDIASDLQLGGAPWSAPVEEAARAAGELLGSGASGAIVGEAARALPPAWAVARVEADGEGRVLALRVRAARGADTLAHLADTAASGGAALGAGLVLTETLPRPNGRVDGRLKGLGLPKLRNALPLDVCTVALPGGSRDAGEASAAAACAALAVLLLHVEGTPRESWPARGSAAAAQMGVRARARAGTEEA